MKTIITMLLALVMSGGSALAQKSSTPAEAEALVKKAIAFYKSNGQEKAFAEISDEKVNL